MRRVASHKIGDMVRNIRMTIAYDGTDFHGWQKQPGLRTVQGEIEQAAQRVIRHPLNIIGAGRTDAGVHARGQVANFLTDSSVPTRRVWRAVGSRLPADASIVHACEAPLDFRATSDAVSKLYRYTIYNETHKPTERLRQRYVYHFWNPLDLDRMRQAAALMEGKRDFAAMAGKGSPRLTTVRTVYHCKVSRSYNEIYVDVIGNGFLYNQVRNMVGTLIEVGRGHWEPSRVAAILESGDRSQAGPTAPACGLTLQWVRYPPRYSRPDPDVSPEMTLADYYARQSYQQQDVSTE
jgi:tRNA pseudouridine38-40 synthase